VKRHPALQDLSRDHHVALIHCQRIRKARGEDATELRQSFLGYARSVLLIHFEEEELLLRTGRQMSSAEGWAEMARRVLADHAAIRLTLADLAREGAGPGSGALLARAAHQLDAHIRYEEAQWFETLQRTMGEAALLELARVCRRFRLKHRGPDACATPATPGEQSP
jgi:hypothetical protein